MVERSLLALTILMCLSPCANAMSINYGDFFGSSVMFLDVTETANTPDDEEPLYLAPTIIGDKLDFDPAGFSATATGGSADLTDGQLNFTLMGISGTAITSIWLSERGDYSLLGSGTEVTQVVYGLGIASVTVLAIDGVSLAVPIPLSAESESDGDDLGDGVEVSTHWDLSLHYDVPSALDEAEIDFRIGATKLEVALNNTLGAISEPSSIAFIAKKDFMIDVETEIIPEPLTLVLAVGCLSLVLLRTTAGRIF